MENHEECASEIIESVESEGTKVLSVFIVEIGEERTLKHYLKYLEYGGAIITLSKGAGGLRELEKPEKILDRYISILVYQSD